MTLHENVYTFVGVLMQNVSESARASFWNIVACIRLAGCVVDLGPMDIAAQYQDSTLLVLANEVENLAFGWLAHILYV